MNISARNVLAGTVVDVIKGPTTSHVRVDVGGAKLVTASITNKAVGGLGVAVGKKRKLSSRHRTRSSRSDEPRFDRRGELRCSTVRSSPVCGFRR